MKIDIEKTFHSDFSLIQSGQFSTPKNTNSFFPQSLFYSNWIKSALTNESIWAWLFILNSTKYSVGTVLLINLFINDLLMGGEPDNQSER